MKMESFGVSGLLRLVVMAVVGMGLSLPVASDAQALGWEGETGVFVTPLAYTGAVEGQKLHAVVAYHYLDAGPVVGQYHEASTEVSFGRRLEFGYTREFHIEGGDPTLSPLYQNGLDIFNGKVIVVPENLGQKGWVPAVSVGFMARTGDRNVGDYMTWNPATNNGSNNGDVYLVATKEVRAVRKLPVVLNAGVLSGAPNVTFGGGSVTSATQTLGNLSFAAASNSSLILNGGSTVTLGAGAWSRGVDSILNVNLAAGGSVLATTGAPTGTGAAPTGTNNIFG